MNSIKNIIVVTAVLALLAGCDSKKDTHVDDANVVSQATEKTAGAEEDLPDARLTTTGKVVSARYADLAFETALPIESVLVRNGQHVKKGQTLAVLDVFKLHNAIEQQEQAIEQAQLAMEQADLKMQDVIITQGYDPDKAAAVPEKVKHNADVKSGYALSKNQLAAARTRLAAAQHELRSGTLTAPFDGVVANLSVQAHQLAQPGQVVCRVIDDKEMEVEFHVMETELHLFKMGEEVTVVPLVDKMACYKAVVNEINPMVDAMGTVTIRARLASPTELYDGMNVEVSKKRE